MKGYLQMQLKKSHFLHLGVFLLGLLLAGCSESSDQSRSTGGEATLEISIDRSWATVFDPDGIKSIDSEQRIPSGNGFNVYSVDFKFDKKGAPSFRIYIDGMFETLGTAVHVDVTDMKGEVTNLFIRRTAQAHQVGYYRKR